MNDRYGCTANAAGKKEILSSAARALVLGLALLLPATAALAIGEPIPGIDIVVKKNPGPIAVTLPSDASGKFSLRLKEPGNYTISTACRQPSGCLPHKLSGALKPGADGEPSIIAILIGLIVPAQKASADGARTTSYNFTVGERGIVLSGQFQDAAGVRVAVGDINGDGRRVAVAVNPVNDAPGIAGDPIPKPDGPPGAPVSTSRSNKKAGVAKGEEPPPDNVLPSAPVNTTRSNKKAGVAKGEEPPPDNVLPSAPVSTTRSNKKAGVAKGEEPPPDNVLPSAPVNTTRSNKKAGIAKGEEPPPDNVLPSAPVNTSRSNKKAGVAKGEEPPPDNVLPSAPVSTTRSNKKAGIAVGDINGDGRAEIRTVPPKTDGTGKPQFKVADNESPLPTGRAFLDGNASLGIITGAGAGGGDKLPGKTGHAPKPVSPGTGPHRSLKAGEPQPEDVKPGISDQGTVGGLIAYGTASPPKVGTRPVMRNAWDQTWDRAPPPPADINGDVKPATIVSSGAQLQLEPGITVNPVNDAPSRAADPIPAGFGQQVTFTATISPINPANNPPGVAGDPVPGTSVGLDHDPGGPISSTKTDEHGAFQFTGLPAGKYTLKLPGLPAKPVIVDTDGIAGGKVMRGSDGTVGIFDRWGNSLAISGSKTDNDSPGSKATANPVPSFPGGVFSGIGIGSVMGGILPGMRPGVGGPAVGGSGAGPMSPAAGPMGPGGPAGPMGPGAIRR